MKNDHVAKFLFYAVCASFIFIYGVAVQKYEIFPYSILYYLKDSAVQVQKEFRVLARLKPVHFLQKARYSWRYYSQFSHLFLHFFLDPVRRYLRPLKGIGRESVKRRM